MQEGIVYFKWIVLFARTNCPCYLSFNISSNNKNNNNSNASIRYIKSIVKLETKIKWSNHHNWHSFSWSLKVSACARQRLAPLVKHPHQQPNKLPHLLTRTPYVTHPDWSLKVTIRANGMTHTFMLALKITPALIHCRQHCQVIVEEDNALCGPGGGKAVTKT